MSPGVVAYGPMSHRDRDRPSDSLRCSSSEGVRKTLSLGSATWTSVFGLRSARSSLAKRCCCCSSSGLVLTTPMTLCQARCAVSVSAAPRWRNGLGAWLVSSSFVSMVSGDQLGPIMSRHVQILWTTVRFKCFNKALTQWEMCRMTMWENVSLVEESVTGCYMTVFRTV